MIGVAFVVGALARSVVPLDHTGMLRVRGKAFDMFWMTTLGVALIVAVLWSAIRGPGEGIPVPIISGSITIVISVLTLALSARRYLRRPILEGDR